MIDNIDGLIFNKDLIWQCDNAGDEVGYDNVDIVGLYNLINTTIYLYIDMDTHEVLESWDENELE